MMRRSIIATAVAILASLSGCAALDGGSLVKSEALPKTTATVRFKKTAGRGTRITLEAKNLAEPEGLTPPAYAYVAWVQSDRESKPQNVGEIIVDADMNGVLRAITPLRDFEFFVTAESSSDVLQPAGRPLLWTHRDDWDRLALGASR